MYTPPYVSSNVVLLQYSEGELFVTLIAEDTAKPNHTLWRLPGTYVHNSHTSLSSLDQTLRQTIGLGEDDISYREQLYTNEHVSDGNSMVCISYLYISREARWRKGSESIGTFSIKSLPRLTPQDRSIINYALDRLHAKSLYSTVLQFLLPEKFDLTQLQQAFETTTGQSVDRRNFRKKITQLDIIKSVGGVKKSRSTTQPQLYRFKRSQLAVYERPFPSKAGSSNS